MVLIGGRWRKFRATPSHTADLSSWSRLSPRRVGSIMFNWLPNLPKNAETSSRGSLSLLAASLLFVKVKRSTGRYRTDGTERHAEAKCVPNLSLAVDSLPLLLSITWMCFPKRSWESLNNLSRNRVGCSNNSPRYYILRCTCTHCIVADSKFHCLLNQYTSNKLHDVERLLDV